jgi:hypothetical protein
MDGGGSDETGSDAADAPVPGNDDVPPAEDTGSAPGDTPVLLDGSEMDTEPLDAEPIDTTVVLLDGASDTTMLDVIADAAEDAAGEVAEDTAEDGPSDVASDRPVTGNCLEQIIANSYSAGEATCAACKESSGLQNPLETQCKAMVDCLQDASCTNRSNPNNCFLGCQNVVSGGSQVETGACVSALMEAANCPTQ